MSKTVRRVIGRCAGVSVSAALAAVGVVALRHALETPQPLKSPLPGEALLYRWRRRSIFYKVLGSAEAPPLVLLHTPDIGASAREMQYIMSPLAQTYRVYALDLLGFGLSDRPNIEYSAAMYSALCQDFLSEVVKKPATLLASGLSCNYAVAAASHSPDLCASLILISPIALQYYPQRMPLRELANAPLVKTLLYPLFSTHLGFILTHDRQKSTQADFAQFYANTHQMGAEHAAMALLAGKLTENTSHAFETLQQPVLMIWGMRALEDRRTTASMHEAAALADPGRRAREVEFIPEAGLVPHEEQPEAVATAIKRWQAETVVTLPLSAESRTFSILAADQRDKSIVEFDSLLAVQPSAQAVQPQQHLVPEEVTTPPEEETTNVSDKAESVALPEKESMPAQSQTSSSAREAQQSQPAESTRDERSIRAYCVKCKTKTKMLNAREVTMKNGRRALRGTCSICGTTLNRMGGLS